MLTICTWPDEPMQNFPRQYQGSLKSSRHWNWFLGLQRRLAKLLDSKCEMSASKKSPHRMPPCGRELPIKGPSPLFGVILQMIALQLDELIKPISAESLPLSGVLPSCPGQVLHHVSVSGIRNNAHIPTANNHLPGLESRNDSRILFLLQPAHTAGIPFPRPLSRY